MSRKKHPEHVNHERWLVSYADFITLLFAFFVVMFASSQADKKKLAGASQAMQSAFNQSVIFDAHSDKPPLDDQSAISTPTVAPTITPAEANETAQEQMREELKLALSTEIASNAVSMRETDAGLVISLHEAGFFASGSADIRKQALPTLEKIGEAIAKAKNNIRVEGHTDNRPIHTAQFASNWELSTTRATRIAHYFLEMPGMDATRFSAAGYAEFHPVASNDTEEGRMQNRRVDIVLLPLGASASAADATALPGMKSTDSVAPPQGTPPAR